MSQRPAQTTTKEPTLKTAIITGITGQDGAYLADLLLGKGYRVIGTYRRSSSVNFWRLDMLGVRHHPDLQLREFDLTDLSNCIRLLSDSQPDEVYNLAAQSFVGVSFEQPLTTADISGIGVLNLLEAIRIVDKGIRFYQASTSELYGKVQQIPQTEDTPFYPRSPYAVAKLFGHWSVVNYRESYDLFASSGILFNHESPLRGKEFVTRKITDRVARLADGDPAPLRLGNMDAKRDWGYAKEYVDGMWRMLQHERADTFVLATNETHSVRDFVSWAFAAVDKHIDWQGSGDTEQGRDSQTGQLLVEVDPAFYRPAEVELLIGDYRKAKEALGWSPQTDVAQLCKMMVDSDRQKIANGVSF
ncbi:GDP-mannose 4,6 dehydratase [Methylophaga frappieri]|uniref:GDP-mannose 4,6-dehydratase n=1 Tax=Methylophaga frappieri (strain ATCC BAA-2434 / DSM 25690 / JAM7) TaxID=754477 RepID=I1YKI5_METFJ|nr:GDP-mannose 4,6 dehydratase [Methylophaga frappieri]